MNATLPEPRAIPHANPFDPTYGCDAAALAAIAPPEAPADFAAFWRATRAESQAVPLRLERKVLPSPGAGWRLSEVSFDSLGIEGVAPVLRVGAWLLEPDGPARISLVCGHGYGEPAVPVLSSEFPMPGHIAQLCVCTPGFSLSRHPGIPNVPPEHVVSGIARRETYAIRPCIASFWAASRALAELLPATAGRMAYSGGSYGGGCGALAAPLEPLWACARLDVPTFGHHPWRLSCRCCGSGEAVRQLHQRDPSIAATLRYFDAAIAATHARIPAFLVPALFDPAVPPPGQWAVVNGWAGPKEIHPLLSGHHDGAWTAAEHQRNHRAWLAFLERQLG